MDKLNKKEILIKLKELDSWVYEHYKLQRVFVFYDFNEAFKFMTLMDLEAERINHHPEWFNIYNKVTVSLITHEVSGISEKDFLLAKSMDEVANLMI